MHKFLERVRSPWNVARRTPSPPFQYRTANAGRSRIYAGRRRESPEQMLFDPMMRASPFKRPLSA